MDLKAYEWDLSYQHGDNFVFYPNEEVIRFVSKYIKKRVGVNTYKEISPLKRGLDLGCGIGRHVIYLDDMEFEAFGIDLSQSAIETARKLCDRLGKVHLKERFVIGDITRMPYDDNYFDFVVSHGVLDSMPFEVALNAMQEVHRVMEKGGLFYFDLISGDDGRHPREFCEEEIVTDKFEAGTVQSYFNWEKLNRLVKDLFQIEEAFLIQRQSVISQGMNARYHLIAKNLS